MFVKNNRETSLISEVFISHCHPNI